MNIFARQKIIVIALGLIAGGILQGCSSNPATGQRQLVLISEQQEIEMGQQAAPELEQQFGGKVDDYELQSYVKSVGYSVGKVSDRQMPYEFTLVKSETPNAFALPGGNVFITAGLIGIIENERQLAAVLAHEVSHVAARHNVMGMQRQMGAAVFVEIAGSIIGADAGTAAKWGAQIATSMVNLKYSRNDEYEADKYGIKYMQRAGYHPYGMVEMLEALNRLSGGSSGGKLSEMFQTHPLTENRIERAREEAAPFGQPGPDPNQARFLQMRRRLAELQ